MPHEVRWTDEAMNGCSSLAQHETIFVSIASYRDSQCQYTLRDLFEKAEHPERIIAGVCFQVAENDDNQFLLDIGPRSQQVRIHFLRHTDARGPCYARALIQRELFKGEDYYFQIDSHMRFVQNWDNVCLEQLGRCRSPKPILTTYASSYTLPKDYEPGEPDRAVLAKQRMGSAIICGDSFGDRNRDDPFLRIKTRVCRAEFGGVPPPALFWTARFAFSSGNVVKEVPYDPHLEFLFFGEEVGMSARLWTSGWDLFNPTEEIAYHLASRAHRYWFREVQTSPEQADAETRAKHRLCGLLGTPWPEGRPHQPPPAPFGLGVQRSLGEYERFAGIDFRRQVVHDRARNGGLSPDMFPPRWAEEDREKIMEVNTLQDVASWAGKDNADALKRQFPEAAAAFSASKSSGSLSTATSTASSSHEAFQARELLRLRIQALQAELYAAPIKSGEGGASELALSQTFASLGQLEAAAGEGRAAKQAFERALQHAANARDSVFPGCSSEAEWDCSLALAAVSAELGLRRYDKAKVFLKDALRDAARALLSRDATEQSEQAAYSVVEAIHIAHEQTDDRQGLEGYVAGVGALLEALRTYAGSEDPVPMPIITAAEQAPQAGAVSLRARLLERVVLICIATGREKDSEVAKRVFTHFRVGRESPNLRRILGMLQSSGAFF